MSELVEILADTLNSEIRLMITDCAAKDNRGIMSYCSIIDSVLKMYGFVCMVNGTSLYNAMIRGFNPPPPNPTCMFNEQTGMLNFPIRVIGDSTLRLCKKDGTAGGSIKEYLEYFVDADNRSNIILRANPGATAETLARELRTLPESQPNTVEVILWSLNEAFDDSMELAIVKTKFSGGIIYDRAPS